MTALSPAPTDLELLSRYRAGHAESFDELYGRHRDVLYHHARAILRDDALAEDLVNETFLKLIEAGDARSAGSLGLFLHVILRRLALDRLRSATASRRREQRFSLEWTRAVDERIDPLLIAELNRALSALPLEQLEVILLHVHAGMTFQETAEALEVPVNTAMSRYRYALQKLSQSLGEGS